MKKVLSILTVALFAFSVFVVTNADGSDGLDADKIWVNNVDISYTPTPEWGSWTEVGDVVTLTFTNDATFNVFHGDSVIYDSRETGTLKIVLEANVTINIVDPDPPTYNYFYGIATEGNLELSGTGTLTITGTDQSVLAGIHVEKDLTIKSGTYDFNIYNDDCTMDIFSRQNVDIQGGTINATKLIVTYHGFQMSDGTLNFSEKPNNYSENMRIGDDYLTLSGTAMITFGFDLTVSDMIVNFEGSAANINLNEALMSDNLTLESTHINANAAGHGWIGFKQSTITFDANGGTTSAEPTLTGLTGKLAELPTATRDGYTFSGWFTTADGGTQVTTSTAFNSNRTIYAHWTTVPVGPTHTVTYDVNGGSAAAPTQADVAENATFTAASYSGTKSGYEFGGWNCDGSTYQAGDTVTMGTSNMTLTAIWNKVTSGVEGQVKWTVVGDKLIIQKNSDDGAMNDYTEDSRPAWESVEGWENVKAIEIADDVTKIGAHAFCKCTVISKVIIPATVTSIGEHAFDGIIFFKDGTEVTTTADNLKGKTYVGSGTDKKLYNLDAAGEKKITFNVDGGTTTSELTVTLGQKLSSLPDAVREGYIFDGWYDAKGVKITADYVFTADTTVTAKWIKAEDNKSFEITSGLIVAISTILIVIGVAVVARFAVKK